MPALRQAVHGSKVPWAPSKWVGSMTFIDHLFDSLNAPGPNQRWLEENGYKARKPHEEMMEERANAAAPHRAASPSGISPFGSSRSGIDFRGGEL